METKIAQKSEKISKAVIKRLPRYRRYLSDLQKKDVKKISSGEFSRLLGCTASQIRQDLNNFGGFGQQGYGYNVNELHENVSKILGLDKEYKTIIIGAGNMGQAIANYIYSYREGFVLSGLFDRDKDLIGKDIRGVSIMGMEQISDFIKTEDVRVAIICTDKDSAQNIVNLVCEAGIEGIWNFAPVDVKVPENMPLENVHLSDGLQSLAYFIHRNKLITD